VKLNLWTYKIKKEGEADRGSLFKFAASRGQGMKNHVWVGSVCVGTLSREFVLAPIYL
jgi:hypothetical protein